MSVPPGDAIEASVEGGAWRLTVRGAVRGATVRRLEEALDEAIAWSSGDVTVDLVEGADLAEDAIAVVLEARRALAEMGRRLVFSRRGS